MCAAGSAAFRNHLVLTAGGTPASSAASSLSKPTAIAAQNRRRSSRPATEGRPGDDNGARPDRSERRFRIFIATSFIRVLRRPLESALNAPATGEAMSELILDGTARHVDLAPFAPGRLPPLDPARLRGLSEARVPSANRAPSGI